MSLQLLTHGEQVAAHLRSELLRGTWTRVMPGILTLEKELGVNRNTVDAALRVLEGEGLLIPEGNGRPRRIVLPVTYAPPSLRIQILPYEDTDRLWHITLKLQRHLLDEGHTAAISSKSLLDLGMNLERVARFVGKTEADAWVVISGSREILDWFAAGPVPAFALFGRRRNVPIAGAGPDKLPALQFVTRHLLGLGHRKIVLLLREEQRKPQPGPIARGFLQELEAHDLPVGTYNIPDWKNRPDGFERCLDSLFRVTPPTALIIDQAFLFNVAQHYLARRGILAPEHVSLVCTDPHPTFKWFRPEIAHIHWNSQYAVRQAVEWAGNVARGRDDRRNVSFKSTFIEGGTIGPMPAAAL